MGCRLFYFGFFDGVVAVHLFNLYKLLMYHKQAREREREIVINGRGG